MGCAAVVDAEGCSIGQIVGGEIYGQAAEIRGLGGDADGRSHGCAHLAGCGEGRRCGRENGNGRAGCRSQIGCAYLNGPRALRISLPER